MHELLTSLHNMVHKFKRMFPSIPSKAELIWQPESSLEVSVQARHPTPLRQWPVPVNPVARRSSRSKGVLNQRTPHARAYFHSRSCSPFQFVFQV